MALRKADAEPRSDTSTASLKEVHQQEHGRWALKQPSFNWNVRDKEVELINFEMEVTNILQTKTYDLTEEENVPIMKLVSQRASHIYQNIHENWKRSIQNGKRDICEKFKPHHNWVVLALQYCKLKRKAMSLPRKGWAYCIWKHQTVSTMSMIECW